MTVAARLEPLPKLLLPAAAVMLFVAVLVGNGPLALVALAGLAWKAAASVRLSVEGAGYRPLRTIDLIEFASADQLDAYDREQANAEARRRAEAQRTAPRY